MLSLASNISSTQAVEAKYSASFGGTDDYIDFGNVHNLGTGDFSFSFWVKASDVTSNFWISKREDDNNRWYIRTEGNDRVQFYAKKSGSDIMSATSSSSGELSANVWNHVVVACDRSGSSEGLKFYINGSLQNSAAASTTDIDNTGDFYIGKFSTNFAKDGTFLEEIGIFNVALDLNNVSAIYNNGSPINLKLNQGNYDNSSALQAYYRMGNGLFDDKANGIVHDQNNPGFGTELLLVPDFSNSGDLDNTTLNTLGYNLQPDSAGGVSTASVQNGELTISVTTPHSNAGRVFMKCAGGVTLTEGNTYKATYTVVSNSDFDGSDHFSIWDGDSYETVPHAVGTHVYYFSFTGSDRTSLPIQLQGLNSGKVLSNISLVKLNGNAGLTSGGVTFSSDTP